MNTVPSVWRFVRAEVIQSKVAGLSIPQFRALRFIEKNEGASLSLVCGHLGSTLSSTSKLVDGLVERGYVSREIPYDDRRRVSLKLTEAGTATLDTVYQAAMSHLAKRLSQLTAEDHESISCAMKLLQSVSAI
jgi:DNA-binding MarR family transcriptional regulator